MGRTLGLAWYGLSVLAVAVTPGAGATGGGAEPGGVAGTGQPASGGVPPITVAEFKEGMLHSYATARDAFAALDASLTDLDAALDENPLDMVEFVRGTKNFKPPLTEEQAKYAFKGLDVNNDGLLESDEFVDGLKSGGFFRVTTTTTLGAGQAKSEQSIPITMAEFKSSMLGAFPSAPDAFAALDASETDLYAGVDENPIRLTQFIQGTRNFVPPLTPAQAEYAFRSLDADSNGVLVSAEFAEGLAGGEFRLREGAKPLQTTGSPAASPAPTAQRTTTAATTTPTTWTTMPTPPEELPHGAFISMDEFKARMLTAHASALKAFQSLGANPAGLAEFVRGTKTFEPPLSDDQATYAFRGLDADHDNSVSSFEFFEVLEFGSFFPKLRDLVLMGAAGSAAKAGSTTMHTPAGAAAERPGPAASSAAAGPAAGNARGTTTGEPGAATSGGWVLRAVALVTLIPVLCMLLPCARGVWQHLTAKGSRLETYKVVRSQSPSSRGTPVPRRPHLPNARRSRFFGAGSIFSCCVISNDDTEEPPLLQAPGCTRGIDRPC